MALPPHWLDDVFKGSGKNSSAAAGAILAHDRFRAAITGAVEDALDAMAKSEEEFRQNPNLMAPSPEQAARQRFIQSLEHRVGNG